jgi:hypothetical protein
MSDKLKAKIRADEEIARKEKERKEKEEEARKLDEQTSKFARNTINQAQRELRKDWRADAIQQIQTKDQFQDFLDNLESQMWYNK